MKRPASKGRARRGLRAKELKALLSGGQSVELLRALGLVREDGSATADKHSKIKQIMHFMQLIEPALEDVIARHPEPVVVDAAAGRSYLGLVLYETYLRSTEAGRLVAIEARPELCEKISSISTAMSFDRVEVQASMLEEADWPERVHFALALHACDTATDAVLTEAVRASADWIALVPCCQAEVARQLKDVKQEGAAAVLWRDPMHRREFGAHLTNVLRVLVLRACGYQVRVTELTGWEHSLKNELILARRVGRYHEGAS